MDGAEMGTAGACQTSAHDTPAQDGTTFAADAQASVDAASNPAPSGGLFGALVIPDPSANAVNGDLDSSRGAGAPHHATPRHIR